ncbi:MAG: hypothetical protein HY077_08435 [Elusimicrobia bacterium]|nr:hypothetical protein [Elusimicrobiota bacterium]
MIHALTKFQTTAAGMALWALLAAAAAGAGSSGKPDCARLGRWHEDRLRSAWMAKEPEGRVDAGFREAAEALKNCPNEERIWYALLRAAELGARGFPAELAGDRAENLGDAAELAARRLPRSVRIMTMLARARGDAPAARAAAALDPSYLPAQAALAAALLKSGDAQGARAALDPLKGLEHVAGGPTLLARARLAAGDPDGALQAASQEPSSIDPLLVEPTARDERPRRAAFEVSGMAQLAAGRYEKAARLLLLAAAEGSDSARSVLRSDGKLRSALETLTHNKSLPAAQRSLLRELRTRTP